MANSIEEGTKWVSARIREVIDGSTIDGVQIRRKDGARSWPVHAFLRYTEPAAMDAAIHGELAACVEEATETGTSVHLRLVILRGGLPSASRSLFVPAPERVAMDDDAADVGASSAPMSAVVATNRDLRGLLEVYARQQGQTVAHAMQGWASAMSRASELEREAAELRAALVVAEQSQQGDPVVQQALMALAPQIPLLLANLSHAREKV